jgi:dTDP-4-dehydrorhamnose 3,5-epimerase
LAVHIHGVSLDSPVNHVDHRGRVFEIYPGPSDHWTDPLVYCYGFTIRPNQTKGWGLHEHKVDRYTLINGEVLTLLYDARTDSPTHSVVQKITLTSEGVRQVVIPAGVWHLSLCLGDNEAVLINHPTRPYDHGKPDRLILPWDTDQIPVDVSSFFPNQLR